MNLSSSLIGMPVIRVPDPDKADGKFFVVNEDVIMLQITVDNMVSPYEVTADNQIILADSSQGEVVLNLPSTPKNNQHVYVKDVSGTGANNSIIINGNGKLIDGYNSYELADNWISVELFFVKDLDKWVIF